MPEPRACKQCNDYLPDGARPDRKFCSDKCRYDYHADKTKLARVMDTNLVGNVGAQALGSDLLKILRKHRAVALKLLENKDET